MCYLSSGDFWAPPSMFHHLCVFCWYSSLMSAKRQRRSLPEMSRDTWPWAKRCRKEPWCAVRRAAVFVREPPGFKIDKSIQWKGWKGRFEINWDFWCLLLPSVTPWSTSIAPAFGVGHVLSVVSVVWWNVEHCAIWNRWHRPIALLRLGASSCESF